MNLPPKTAALLQLLLLKVPTWKQGVQEERPINQMVLGGNVQLSNYQRLMAYLEVCVREAAVAASAQVSKAWGERNPSKRRKILEEDAKKAMSRVIRDKNGVPVVQVGTFMPKLGNAPGGLTWTGREREVKIDGIPMTRKEWAPIPTVKVMVTANVPNDRGGYEQTDLEVKAMFNGRGGFLPLVRQVGPSGEEIDWTRQHWGPIAWEPSCKWLDRTGITFALIQSRRDGRSPRPIPLGMASEGSCTAFNTFYELCLEDPDTRDLVANLRPIQHMPHGFHPDAEQPTLDMFLIGSPDILMWKNKEDVAEKEPDYRMLHYMFGGQIELHKHSKITAEKSPDGTYPTLHFKITPTEGGCTCTYHGQVDHSSTVVRREGLQIDGFVALDLVPEKTKAGKQVNTRGAHLYQEALKGKVNSLLKAAVQAGVLDVTKTIAEQKSALATVRDAAIHDVNSRLYQLADAIEESLLSDDAVGRPSMASLVPEVSKENFERLLMQREGDCALATWIAEAVNNGAMASFDWSMPLLVEVRRQVIIMMVQAECNGMRVRTPDRKRAKELREARKAEQETPASNEEAATSSSEAASTPSKPTRQRGEKTDWTTVKDKGILMAKAQQLGIPGVSARWKVPTLQQKIIGALEASAV